MATTTTQRAYINYPIFFKRLTAEFIGTFYLVLVAQMTIAGKSELTPLATGITLMVMVFTGGHISGGHFNPAVTLGVWSNHGVPDERMVCYCVVQCCAGTAAAGVSGWLLPAASMYPTETIIIWQRIVLAELLGTFALVYMVLNVALHAGRSGNAYYGLASGFTLMAMVYTLGHVSGGIFNPALIVGLYITGHISNLALLTYVAGHLAGSMLAAFIFKVMDDYMENKNLRI